MLQCKARVTAPIRKVDLSKSNGLGCALVWVRKLVLVR